MNSPRKTLASELPKYAVIAFFGFGLIVFMYRTFVPDEAGPGPVEIAMPELSENGTIGRQLFDDNCAACHGVNAAGSENGPPLIHDIYNPGHHPDEAFYAAAEQGVRQHHWPFGNMPIQSQVTKEHVEKIVRFIREVQVANGIVYREHKM